MIDEAGNVQIMDFEIARSLESKSITGAGVMIGTPEYMSPESGNERKSNQRPIVIETNQVWLAFTKNVSYPSLQSKGGSSKPIRRASSFMMLISALRESSGSGSIV
jgi:serine/threonine protein kinase